LYWFANNIWTFGQQHYVFGMIEKEDEAKKQEVIERRAANAPAPGAKPKRNPKTAPPGGNGSAKGDDDAPNPAETDSDVADGSATGADDGPSNRTPRPGARPKKRKR
jgi:YidC/Oxa1 family membrane protein insertase